MVNDRLGLAHYLRETTPKVEKVDNKKRIQKLMLTSAEYKDMIEITGLSMGGVKYFVNQLLQDADVQSRAEYIADKLNHRFTGIKVKGKLSELDDDIMTQMLHGYSIKESAQCFDITISEVRNARQRIFRATGERSALALIYKCYGVE